MKKNTIFKRNLNLLLYAFMVIVFLFILFNEFIYPINKYFIVLVVLLFFILCKEENSMVAMLLFLLPLYNALPNNYITALFVLIFIFKYRKNKISFKHILFVALVLIYELLHFVFDEFSIYEYFIDAFYIILFFMLISCNNYTKNELKKIGIVFSLSLIFSCVVVLLKMMSVYTVSQIFANGLRLGVIEAENKLGLSLTINPNTIAVFCVVAIGINFVNEKIKLFQWCIILALTIFGSLTLSRNFLLSMLIFISFILFFGKRRVKGRVFVLIFMIAIIIAAFIPEVFTNYIERFSVDDITNERMQINSSYFQTWSNSFINIFFGRGIQNYQSKYKALDSVHNATLELLICWGLIGTILFIVAIAFNVLYKNKYRYNKITLLLLLTYFISIQSIRLITTPELLLLLGVILIFRNYGKEIIKKIDNTIN